LEDTRWQPRRAEAQSSCADGAGGIRLCELATFDQLAVLGNRAVEVELRLAQQAALQLPREDAQLSHRGAARSASGASEAVPRPRERQEVRASSSAMGREHRAHAAAAVHVGAGDDALALNPVEHRAASGSRQAVDRATQILHWSAVGVMALSHRLLPRRMSTWPAATDW
jgi:hypothetical protein